MKPEDFVDEALAKELLGLRTRAGVRMLVFRSVLDPCVCGDLDTRESIGLTRASVEREVQRRPGALTERRRFSPPETSVDVLVGNGGSEADRLEESDEVTAPALGQGERDSDLHRLSRACRSVGDRDC